MTVRKTDTMSRSEKNTRKPPEQEQGQVPSTSGHTGDYLRRLREERGLSIAEVSRSTRISETNLRAIEGQNFAALPADTFTRGLLNIYAKFLEADPAEIVTRFMQERDESQAQGKRIRGKPVRGVLTPKTMAEPAHVSSMFMGGLVLLIIIVLFTGFCIYTEWNPFGFLVRDKYDIHQVLSGTFPDTTESSPAAAGADGYAAVAPAAPEEPVIAVPSTDAGVQDTEGAQSVGEPSASTRTISVRFLTDGVVTVAGGGSEPVSRTHVKGEEQSWTTDSSMTLTFDKPDAAAVFVDNMPVPFPADGNGSYTLRIPDDLPKSAAHD